MRLAAVLLIACSAPPRSEPVPPAPAQATALAALPKQAPIDTAHFTGVTVCVRCHTAGDTAMRDPAGHDISPVIDAQSSLMGLSARDPYFLAALRRELDANPAGHAVIEALCLRCHAPVGFAESPAIGLADVEHAATKAAALARDGIACLGCHALAPDGLGDDATFTGLAALRTDRVTFGALPEPLAEAMVTMSKTTPLPGAHMTQSLLCASCHTVIVRPLDAAGQPTGEPLAEQATFLEWRDSAFAATTPCQGCHMPEASATPFATRPPDAPPRAGYRRHTLRGGNAYLLDQLARNATWLAAPAAPVELATAAADTRAFLKTAAKLAVTHTGTEWRVVVENLTGHKLPTGFPTRRMWLHVIAKDAGGQVVFESGGTRAGALVGNGKRLDGAGTILPHRDRITAADEVALWEAVPVDARGVPTHLLLGAVRFAKDDRILPAGWRVDHPDGARTQPVGAPVEPGRATVTVIVPATAASVTFELDYQAIPPETIESYQQGPAVPDRAAPPQGGAKVPQGPAVPDRAAPPQGGAKVNETPEAVRFVAIVAAPPEPEILASVTQPAQ